MDNKTEAQKIETALDNIDRVGLAQASALEELKDLARGYLSAIKSGVPEEIQEESISPTMSFNDYAYGFNTCRSQMIVLLVEKDREIERLKNTEPNGYDTNGNPIKYGVK